MISYRYPACFIGGVAAFYAQDRCPRADDSSARLDENHEYEYPNQASLGLLDPTFFVVGFCSPIILTLVFAPFGRHPLTPKDALTRSRHLFCVINVLDVHMAE